MNYVKSTPKVVCVKGVTVAVTQHVTLINETADKEKTKTIGRKRKLKLKYND